MRQLLLDIPGVQPQTFATFVTGRNDELLALLHTIAGGDASGLDQRFVYLWAEAGCGKSHLLKALQAMCCDARLLGPDSDADDFTYAPATWLYLVDDCERLKPAQQVATFALFNQIRERGGVLVTAGAAAPATLALRDDLRTRLGWGLIYQVHGLADEEKLAALERAAQARGFHLAPGLLPWLITHFRRDMPSLAAVLDALDRYSLETKRPVTLPLLKELLELGEVQIN
ncbi:DnaA regulatory inactivator Hda [Lacisediminimonas sp.]|uniref:DnaA regulatory inactivator Hda n=1 Tax=Lacisediminimonas sp. TaxID=3060582 RepID=UPI00271929DD|nr:DnaA regulatory inactivator Hda [Lacisediminimonas sp.]MDO8300346.1 DnaA regulatory inactivator Hda [Lacisediminimonas sp.]